MLGFAKQQTVCAERQGLLPVRRGDVLLVEHAARLVRIRSMIGVPAQHWRLLYGALFAAYAEYVQQISVPESCSTLEPGTQLRHALVTVELALKVRRGYVLPPGKEPEIVANEQDVWTYAVASAALLQGTGKALLNQRVMLHDRNRRPVSVWSPWTGSMIRSGIAYYRVNFVRDADAGLAQSALPLLVTHVLPADGLRWLAGHEDALAAWLATISGHALDGWAIAEIVRKASQPSTAESASAEPESRAADVPQSESSGSAVSAENRSQEEQAEAATQREALVTEGGAVDPDESGVDDRGDARTVRRTNNHPDDPGEAFLQWISSGIASGMLAVNSAKAHLHVVDAGLLLVSPAVFRAFAGDNWRDVQKRVLKRKLTAKTASGENIFHYWQTASQGRKTVKGMLIRNPQQRLGVPLPLANPQLVPKQGCA